jgi:hypothetical protein
MNDVNCVEGVRRAGEEALCCGDVRAESKRLDALSFTILGSFPGQSTVLETLPAHPDSWARMPDAINDGRNKDRLINESMLSAGHVPDHSTAWR